MSIFCCVIPASNTKILAMEATHGRRGGPNGPMLRRLSKQGVKPPPLAVGSRHSPKIIKMSPDDVDLVQLVQQKDGAYHERNQLVALLAALFPSSLDWHPEEDMDWRWIVFIDTPAGQMSWHIHDAELSLFDHVPRNQGWNWDGHTTEETYQRVRNLIATIPERKEATAVPRELVNVIYEAEASQYLAMQLSDAFIRALGNDLFAARGVAVWEQGKLPSSSEHTDFYHLQMRVVASKDSLLSDTSPLKEG